MATKAFVFVALLCLSSLTAVAAVSQQQWVLQLGYFSGLQNALDLKEQLTEAGFDVQTMTTNESGGQVYRVIGGWADDPEEFDTLRDELEDATGERGYVLLNPYLGEMQSVEKAEKEFAQPRTRYLLAQTGTTQPMGGESVGSAAVSGYNPDIFRTPQEEIDSIPGFTAAGMQIIPTLGLSIGYDDNIGRTNILEDESFFYIVAPAIRVELPSDHSILAVTAAVDIIRYTDSDQNDQTPWYVRGDWAWDPSTRQDFNLFAQYGEGVDDRGTGRLQGNAAILPIPLDEWERFDYGGIWRYGAIGARGKLDLQLGGSNLDYTNNRQATYLLDRDWWYGTATFYWRVAPKTSLLAEYSYTDINYDVADRDSTESAWLVGVSWDATARTSGTLRYGNMKKDFDDPSRKSYNGPTWMASVDWQPRTYSLFTLTGTRSTQEPDGNGDFVLRQDVSIAWTHDWATRFGTIVDLGYGTDDYRPTTRKDNIWYWSVGARYMFSPHFRFGASIQGYDRDSDIEQYNYKRHVYMLTLESSF